VFILEAHYDPGSVRKAKGAKVYAARVESGVVTWATWLMIQTLPTAARAQYENLRADSIILYPRKLVATSGAEFDILHERYGAAPLPWEAELDLERMQLVHRERIDSGYVALRYSIDNAAAKIREFRAEAQKREGKGSGADRAWKQQANTMYGVLASPH